MREAHEVPSCSEEMPFYPRVMTQEVGNTRKSTDLVRASRCEQPKLVSASEAAGRAACFVRFATSVVPRDGAFTTGGTRARQWETRERAAGFPLALTGRIHRGLDRRVTDSRTPVQEHRRYAVAVRTGRPACNRSVNISGPQGWGAQAQTRLTERASRPRPHIAFMLAALQPVQRSAARVARDAA
jgi:hypothetical protein